MAPVIALVCAACWAGCARPPGASTASAPTEDAQAVPLPRMTGEEAVLRMRLLSFEPAGDPESVSLSAGERVSLRRSIPARHCAVFGALGSPGIDALALRLRAAGELLAADISGRPFAFVTHCAEEDMEVSLELSGERTETVAQAVVLGFGAPRDAVPEWAGPPLRIVPGQRDPAAVESAIFRRLDSAGYEPGSVLLEAPAAATGDRHRIRVDLAAGQCGMLVAAAGPGPGRLIVETRPGEASPSRTVGDDLRPALVSLCATKAGPPAIEVAVIAGSGPVRAVFHPLPLVPLPAGLADPPLAIKEAAAIFARHGMAPQGDLPAVAPVSGTAWAAPFTARPGSCYGFAGARRDDIAIETFRLTDAAGHELGRWTGPASPALLVRCVHRAPEELVIEVVEGNAPMPAQREPPVIVVFYVEAAAAAPFLDPR